MVSTSLKTFGLMCVGFAIVTYVAAIGGIVVVEQRHKYAKRTHDSTMELGEHSSGILHRLKLYVSQHTDFWEYRTKDQTEVARPTDVENLSFTNGRD